jgi:hypothetical protein
VARRNAGDRKLTRKTEERGCAVSPPLKQGRTDGGEAERKEQRCGGTGEEWDKWDEWVDGRNEECVNLSATL